MRFLLRIAQISSSTALVTMFLACGGGGGTPTSSPTPSPAFTLSTNAQPEIVVWKNQTTTPSTPAVSVTINPSNGFTAPVTLSAVGVPQGATAQFAPAASSTSSQCVFNVDSRTTSGTYPITISGAGGGVNASAPSFNLTVKEGFRIALSDAALSVKAGSSTLTRISILGSQAFVGTTQLSVSGLPTGVTTNWGLYTSNIHADGELTLKTDPTVAPGTYPLLLHGISGGVPEQTTPLTLTVSSSTPATLTPAEKAGQMVRNVLQLGQFALAPGQGGMPAQSTHGGEQVPLALNATGSCFVMTTNTTDPNHISILLDFQACPNFSGSIGYLFASSASGFLSTAAYNNFSYSNTYAGNTLGWKTNGVIVAAGALDPGAQSLTYVVSTQGPFSAQWTLGGQTYAYTLTMSEAFTINLATYRFTTTGTYTYSDGSDTWSITIPEGTPLVVDFLSGCLSPSSGTMNITGPSGTFSATFGPGCGTVTINPGNVVFNL